MQGQEGYAADEAAQFYVKHYTKKKLGILKAPLGVLKLLRMFAPKFNYGPNIIEALNNYPEKFQAEETWNDLGKPQTRFIDYIRESA